jgi:magnesium transporter
VLLGFVPMIMGIGGNVGIQSATLAIRSLATGRLARSGGPSFVWREARVALSLGLCFALLLGFWGEFRFAHVGLSVAFSVAAAMTLAGMLGASIPLALARVGVDPAVATGPFVTAALDLLGIAVYFGVCHFLVPS